MATDDFGQGINVAALLDAPDAATLARNLANGLAARSVLVYASASARTAAMTGVAAPVEGMHSYLKDVQRLYEYTGTAWRQVSSLTQQGTVSMSWTNADTASLAVTFPFAFASVPNVFVNINNAAGSVARWSCRAYSITATGFTILLYGPAGALSSGAAIPVQWFATLN